MNLQEKFIVNIHTKNLFTKKDKLLIAVSGGVDSIALCMLCKLTGFDFGIAHCNFQLRGADSDSDEQFVQAFAKQLNVDFYSVKFDTKNYAKEKKLSTQTAARELRYKWFSEIAEAHQFHYILTAHHADDNIETALMTFFRGTGIKGLTGIKEKNKNIRRPLLFVRKKELENFLTDRQQPFVQDVSNLQNDYTRNFIRNKILPMIAEMYPEINQNVLSNIERMKSAVLLYDEIITQKRKKIIEQKGSEFYISVLLLQQQPAMPTILYEITKNFGFTSHQQSDILQLLQSESGKYVLSATHRILRNRKHVIIAPLPEIKNTAVVIEKPGDYAFANGTIAIKNIERKNFSATDDANVAFIDAKNIEYPLLLRPWKIGDYFYPLGMQKKKKLSRFFIDKKLSMIEKEKVWVLEINQKIIWVVGYRIDDRFKITPTTKKILQLKIEMRM